MTTTSINQAEIITGAQAVLNGQVRGQHDGNSLPAQQPQAGNKAANQGKAESELRAAARRHGLSMKELAHLMGVNAGYLSDVANGRRPWTPMVRERVMAVLGEVPGQGIVYRQGGVVTGESTYIRERAREKGMSLKDLAVVVGVSYGYMTQAARGQRNMSPSVQVRVESALDAPAKIEAAQCANKLGCITSSESTYIRERAREKGMSLKDLAVVVGVSYGYMTQAARGQRNMSPSVQVRVESALDAPAKIEAAQCANKLGCITSSESTYIRERARVLGISMGELADLVGLSRGYLTQASRGKRCLSPAAQARVEKVLDSPVRVEAAQLPSVDPRALWDRMDAHGWSQNETARRAGISSALLSQIMNGQRTPSGKVLRNLHGVLFQPSAAELVVPAEVKVMAWKKGGRNGVVVKGAGGPGSNTIRTGGRVPWGAEVEFAYTSGYDSRGRVSVTHLVDERGYGVMLNKAEQGAH